MVGSEWPIFRVDRETATCTAAKDACAVICFVMFMGDSRGAMDRVSCGVNRSSRSIACERLSYRVNRGAAPTPVGSGAVNVRAASVHGGADRASRGSSSKADPAAIACSWCGSSDARCDCSDPRFESSDPRCKSSETQCESSDPRCETTEHARRVRGTVVLVRAAPRLMRCPRCTIRSQPRTVRSPGCGVRCIGQTVRLPRNHFRSPDSRQRRRRRRFRFI